MPTTITPDERRALEFITAESAGCLEHHLIARGFNVECLAGLVRSGLVGVTAERVASSAAAGMVFRLSITKRGIQTLVTATEAWT